MSCAVILIDVFLTRSRNACLFEGCPTTPSYGYEKGQPMFCHAHNFDNLDDVVSKRCESKIGTCKKRPTYGFEKGHPKFCKAHAEPGMEDVVNKRCSPCISGCVPA